MKLDEFKKRLYDAFEHIGDMTDAELDKMVDELEWEHIQDMYPDDEDELERCLDDRCDEDLDEDTVVEGISATARMRKRMSFMRNAPKTRIARNTKLRRAASSQVLRNRARVAARRSLYKKFLRGRKKASMTASEKDRIETQISRMKNIQFNLANRMIPKIRELEIKRLASIRANRSGRK